MSRETLQAAMRRIVDEDASGLGFFARIAQAALDEDAADDSPKQVTEEQWEGLRKALNGPWRMR